ncbi:hypothetical protein, unlikely [Trypanosoma brucei gambiense DAL972]|uniref:Uncharacterized protein n=1 Tax=Trypanosoma brucei gambiense (strain MHOM/CI/86/DAL972) TaxID=679716 RepID=C9ZSR3_TRYB9|nr:hypothetical protein, unlikely [Trypanosoma brucei gambiense DAL972]CBH12447.1 hypothetical protein, unlikely [Trypanosoma brucei gambiense DAL972]|eukprot:XP_011774728.1 hypothetical protein, unlikely [Trypanosoma brucei gambiense DAL972]
MPVQTSCLRGGVLRSPYVAKKATSSPDGPPPPSHSHPRTHTPGVIPPGINTEPSDVIPFSSPFQWKSKLPTLQTLWNAWQRASHRLSTTRASKVSEGWGVESNDRFP